MKVKTAMFNLGHEVLQPGILANLARADLVVLYPRFLRETAGVLEALRSEALSMGNPDIRIFLHYDTVAAVTDPTGFPTSTHEYRRWALCHDESLWIQSNASPGGTAPTIRYGGNGLCDLLSPDYCIDVAAIIASDLADLEHIQGAEVDGVVLDNVFGDPPTWLLDPKTHPENTGFSFLLDPARWTWGAQLIEDAVRLGLPRLGMTVIGNGRNDHRQLDGCQLENMGDLPGDASECYKRTAAGYYRTSGASVVTVSPRRVASGYALAAMSDSYLEVRRREQLDETWEEIFDLDLGNRRGGVVTKHRPGGSVDWIQQFDHGFCALSDDGVAVVQQVDGDRRCWESPAFGK